MALTDSIEHKLDRGLSELRRTGRRVGRSTRSAARDLHEDVTDDLRSLVDELEDLLKNDGDGDIAALRKRVQARLDEARSTLDYASGNAAVRLRESAERMAQVVHDNPWQTAGVVGGLAFVVGLLLARR
ncbi:MULTISPECIES: DUF883 family protein [Burkholderia]|uniref:DUF883 domain-containing protein n=1 Tax=Burkholderia vietnamiensis TaxID=60552 RepID=A0ABS1AQE8_BURVI|nr:MULTISPECIES: DUF883 family protein [Burkholderia]AOJ98147.1 hypothetical protein WK23_05525 [Burkholderia vietnamiensis]KVF83559.1 hypothetical protein WJ19_22115 [Burkholderia vietnamiensis]KVF83992.1 hypothetical protein WJ18_03450 [Burkholderia vietnamiensis]KVF93263.1 hypothetical protein WJ20_07265 [Burkholderia vietnamiensis]KVF99434.1 hypothetical protein WJ22_19155 [Burkholderia vietnamiensis]